MPSTQATDKQQLATILLGESVHDWIRKQRRYGYSWRDVATMLATATDGRIVISHESCRQWSELS